MDNRPILSVRQLASGAVVFAGLYLVSLYNYTLFHSLAEMFSVAVAAAIFILIWNSRRYLDDGYVQLIGISFLFIGAIDLVHTLAFKGMNIFQGYGSNLATQLWIGGRYMEALTFLAASFFIGRRLRLNAAIIAYSAVTAALFASVFGGVFPDCFIEGQGLTPFKVWSEYVISLILLTSIGLLIKKREHFEPGVLKLIVSAIALTIASELAFTKYISVFGAANLIGHFLKILAFYFIYKAVVETGLMRPYDLLFRDLKKSEEASAHLASFPRLNPNPVIEVDFRGQVIYQNDAATAILDGLSDKNVFSVFFPHGLDEVLKTLSQAKEGQSIYREISIKDRWFSKNITLLPKLNTVRAYMMDITGLKKTEEALKESEGRLNRSQEIAHLGSWELDLVGNRLFWSDEVYRIFGLEPREFGATFEAFLEAVHPDDRMSVSDAYSASIKEGRDTYEIEHRVVRKSSGEVRTVHEKCEHFRDASGRIVRSVGMVHDITERNAIEKELLNYRDHLESLVSERTKELEGAYEAVGAERKRFFDVFETLPAYIILLTEDYHVTYDNRFFRERFGEHGGRRCYEYLFDRKEPCEICETYSVLKTKAPHEWEWTGPDGRNYYIYDFPFTDVDGSNLILEMGIDITEQKQAQEALKKLNETLAGVNEHLSTEVNQRLKTEKDLISLNEELEAEVVMRRQAEDGLQASLAGLEERVSERTSELSALLYASRAVMEHKEFKDTALDIFNYCKHIVGASAGYVALLSADGAENEVLFLDSGGHDCTVDPSLPMPIRGLREVAYATGRVAYENDFARSKWAGFMPEGHTDLENVLFAPLVIGGKAVGLLGLGNKPGGFNENDAKMASAFGELAAIALHNSRLYELLSNNEEKFRSIAETASDAIVVADQNGGIVFWNPGAERTFGYTAPEMIGGPLSSIMPEALRGPHEAGMRRFMSEGVSTLAGKAVEISGMKKDGSVVPIELSLAHWKTKDGVFVAGIMRDITERKVAEEQRAGLIEELESANKELNDFAYIVSHDLKAPLRSISSLADWLSTDYGDRLDHAGKEQLGLLLNRVKRMHGLIEGILKYSRTGRAKEERTEVDLNGLMAHIGDIVSPPGHIKIKVEGRLPTVHVERTRIEQVFANLIGNAVKFMDKPDGEVRVGCVSDGGFYKFSVSDNGPGIDKRHHERIFQIFQTLSPKDDLESTGIGLSIVKKVVETYGGRVWVVSEKGAGSTFYFTLPLELRQRL